MDPGIAAGTARHIPAGEPAVFPLGVRHLIQPDFKALDQSMPVPDRNEDSAGTAHSPVVIACAKSRQAQQLVALGAEKAGQQPPPPLRLRHTAVLIVPDAFLRQSPAQQILTVSVQERQMLQHRRVSGVARLQRKWLPLCNLGSWLLGETVDVPALLQLQICFFVTDAVDPGVQ